jgi:hypothetical protein
MLDGRLHHYVLAKGMAHDLRRITINGAHKDIHLIFSSGTKLRLAWEISDTSPIFYQSLSGRYRMPVILSFLKSKRTLDSGPFFNVTMGSSITLPMMGAVISLSRKREMTASEFFGETERTNPKL